MSSATALDTVSVATSYSAASAVTDGIAVRLGHSPLLIFALIRAASWPAVAC